MSKKRAEMLEKYLYLKGCKGFGKNSYGKVSNDIVESLIADGFNNFDELEQYLIETKHLKKQKNTDSLYD